MKLETRIGIEKRIIKHLVRTLLENGYSISVDDGEEVVLSRSTNAAEIIAATQSTDEDVLHVYDIERQMRGGFVHLVYGNDGFDVICDYAAVLEDVLAPVNAYAEEQAEIYG